METEMRVRHDDETGPGGLDQLRRQTGGQLKVTREIPLWGILCVLGAFSLQAAGMYYSQQRLAEQMTDVRAAVRELTAVSNTRERDVATMQLRIEDLGRRVTVLEQRVRP